MIFNLKYYQLSNKQKQFNLQNGFNKNVSTFLIIYSFFMLINIFIIFLILKKFYLNNEERNYIYIYIYMLKLMIWI